MVYEKWVKKASAYEHQGLSGRKGLIHSETENKN